MITMVDYYLKAVSGKEQKATSKEESTKIIEASLKNGWSIKQVKHAIDNRHPSAIELRSILYPKNNLISDDEIYYHSELRLLPPPPKSMIDDKGNVIYLNLDEECKVEMVRVYTMYNLLKYFYAMFSLAPNINEVRRDSGAMNYLLKVYSIDQILFMIDTAWGFIDDEDRRPPNSPLDIQAYSKVAIEAYEEKVAYDRAVGVIGG